MDISSLSANVTRILQEVSSDIIMPRFQAIPGNAIKEKSPGDLVTIVDHEVETALIRRLPELLAGSRVIGEEGVAANPALINALNDGWVWLVDPLDGTRNFVEGSRDFAVMVALLRDGIAIASWIYSPIYKTLAFAELGGGAYWNSQRVQLGASENGTRLRGNVHTRFLPATWAETIRKRAANVAELLPPSGSAGATYPLLLQRETNFIVYWRTLAWDHVPGILMLQEAGGHTARFDGSAYRAPEVGVGLLVAASVDIWHTVREFLP